MRPVLRLLEKPFPLLLACLVWILAAPAAAQRAVPTIDQAEAQLEAVVAKLRAAGEPTTAAELAALVISEHPRGRALLEAAQATDSKHADWLAYWSFDAPGSDWRPSVERLRLPQGEELAMARSAIAVQGDGLDALRRARSLPASDKLFDWDADYAKPLMDICRTPDEAFAVDLLSALRDLARAAYTAARVAMAEGRGADAVEHAADLLFLSQEMGGAPNVIGPLVQFGTAAYAADAIVSIGLRVQLGDEDPMAVAPDRLRALITQLLDDRPFQRSMRFAQQAERVKMFQAVETLSAAGRASSMSVADAADIAMLFQAHLAALEQPTLGGFHRVAAEQLAWWDNPEEYLVYPFGFRSSLAAIAPHLPSLAHTQYRSAAQRRLAATALAARLYVHDNQGHLPPTLAALVPEYLPEPPADPLSLVDQPLGFDRESGIIWSVGEDATTDAPDDRGSEGEREMSNREMRLASDLVYRLTPPDTAEPTKAGRGANGRQP